MSSEQKEASKRWTQMDGIIDPTQPETGLSRVGVIDVGSNSVRMVVFDGAARSPAYFFNEKVMCELGAGLSETGILNPKGRQRALAAIARFVQMARAMDVPKLNAVATAAVRDAKDGKAFCKEVLDLTGQHISIVNGEEEARLSAQGVLLGWPGSYGLVCDIGGSSMELAEISGGVVGKCLTSNLGPLQLKEIKGGEKARAKEIKATVKSLAKQMGPQHNRLFLVGGSWRALARIDMHRRGYPLHVLHEYRMNSASVRATIDYLANEEHEDLRLSCGVSQNRMALVPYAAEVLDRLLKEFNPADIAISSYGIREGMLYEVMPDEMRAADPLLAASRFIEEKDARVPGFGDRLYDFVLPLFSDAESDFQRIIRAACLLHDVSWRAHPDFRANLCFETATRSNLGGLKHWERVFLGVSLLHRYRNKREGSSYSDLFPLLSNEEMEQAEILGKAMRIGAMLWVKDNKKRAALKWNPKTRHLALELSQENADLYGEVCEARLHSLATTLDATTSLSLV